MSAVVNKQGGLIEGVPDGTVAHTVLLLAKTNLRYLLTHHI